MSSTEELQALARRWKTLTAAEREARLAAACGMLAGGKRTLDDFLREKHEEIAREETEWESHHRTRRGGRKHTK